MNGPIRHCLLEAVTQRELEEKIAEMEAKGWRMIASPSRSAPHWVQVLYLSDKPISLEVVRVNPASFEQRDQLQSERPADAVIHTFRPTWSG